MRVGLRGVRLLRLGHLGAQALQLLVERRLVRQQRRELLVALAQRRFQLSAAARRSASGPARSCGSALGVEGEPGRGRSRARVGAREPVADVEQLAHRRQRVDCRNGAWLCTARLPSVLITRALLNTASPAACLKLGSWISALRLSW